VYLWGMAKRGPKRASNDTPSRRAAERAIKKAKKPENLISPRAPLAREAQQPPAFRLRQLSILPEIVDWIKEGYPDAEVARRIHQEGFLETVQVHTLAQEVRTYRLKVLRPGDVAERQLSKGMVDAVGAVKRGLDELEELHALAIEQRTTRQKARASLDQNMQVIALIGQSLLNTMEEDVEAVAADRAEGKKIASAREPKLTAQLKALMKANSQMVKDAKELGKLESEARKTLLTSAQVRSLLGLENTGQFDTEEVVEQRLTEYVTRRFNGPADARKVLQDPQKRARVMRLYRRMITDEKLLADLEHKYPDGEPEQNDDPGVIDVPSEDVS